MWFKSPRLQLSSQISSQNCVFFILGFQMYPSPEGMQIVSSFKVTKGTKEFFTHPVIHDGVLYIRHGEALMAYSIKKGKA